MNYRFAFSCWIIVSLFSIANAEGQEVNVRIAIDKSLPYLWSEGQGWIDKRGCVSCHQIPFMVWSLNAASTKEFEVDEQKLQELINWSTTIDNFVNPKNRDQDDQQEVDTANGNIDTMAQLLLAVDDIEERNPSAWREKFSQYLSNAQQADGTWKACGQLPAQKRPKPETTAVTTYWTAYSLRTLNSEAPFKFPIFDEENTTENSGESTEWWAVQLLLAHQSGDSAKVSKLQKRLIEFQHEDGGWGWLTADESDAFGTGVAIYSLLKSGVREETSEIKDAINFLLKTQEPNGAWQVRSTKGKHQKQFTPTATYWGTAWAIIGLLETL
ncbi:terpene cyclase/mutase family protein [bacterium]|jgi:hypothetical protein|nr:terpene cyclase/mutase family protein [Planctomicrobium sp.]MDA7503802.1 terpene cyclase/mutase family protein [bacterium]